MLISGLRRIDHHAINDIVLCGASNGGQLGEVRDIGAHFPLRSGRSNDYFGFPRTLGGCCRSLSCQAKRHEVAAVFA